MSITVKVDDKEVRELMKQLHKASGDLRPFFKHTAVTTIHQSTLTNFRRKGRPKKWAPLSGLSLANKKTSKTAIGSNVLFNSGTLRKSIGTVKEIRKHSLEYGTNLIYARTMQGAEGKRFTIIRPVRGQYLTIPTQYATPGKKARDYKNTFVAKKVIFQTQEDKSILPLFYLKKSIKIPARPYMVWQEEDIKNLAMSLLTFLTDVKTYKKLI